MTPEEVELLSELTIVMPTYNHPLELERAIEYWRDLPVTVHILDGSEKPFFPVGQIIGSPRIFYHHLPPKNGESSRQNYSFRINFGTRLPVTRYTALCADDDAFTLSGLRQVLETLNAESGLDAMIGRTAMYDGLQNISWFLRYHDLRSSNVYVSNDVFIRLINDNRAPWLYYGVVKTELWKKLFQLSFEFDIPMGSTEQLTRLIDRCLCRIKIIEHILWIRQENQKAPGPSLIKPLVNWSRFYERRIMKNQLKKAIRFIDPSASKVRAYIVSQDLTAHRLIRKFFSKKRLGKVMISNFIGIFRHVPLSIRWRIVKLLPPVVTARLGYYPISKERQHATTRTNCDEFISNLSKTDIRVVGEELKNYEKLLKMPREELRLRANI